MTPREPVTKAVDFAIGVAVFSVVAAPVWFCAWWFISFHPGDEPHPRSDAVSGSLWIAGMAFASPARTSSFLLRMLHVSASDPLGGLLHWIAACISVPFFWNAAVYLLVQLFRHVCFSHQEV